MDAQALTDILHNFDSIRQAWDNVAPAEDFQPLPRGEYIADIIDGRLFEAAKGTPGYKLTFRVTEGEYAGRKIWHDLWLTAHALPMAKRDLAKLGITELEQLRQPLPPGIRCRVYVIVEMRDDGQRFNKVRRIDTISINTPCRDPFAPAEDGGAT